MSNDKIHVTTTAFSPHPADAGITLRGCTREEVERLEAAFRGGHYFVRAVGGRLEYHASYEELPAPHQDPQLFPFWRTLDQEKAARQRLEVLHDLSGDQETLDDRYPSITIQHLCVHSYFPDQYQHTARQMEGYGFECLRSRRGHNGRFWEIWYLPSLCCAKGSLEEAIGKGPVSDQVRRAVTFLSKNVSFGTLDVSVQRAALVYD